MLMFKTVDIVINDPLQNSITFAKNFFYVISSFWNKNVQIVAIDYHLSINSILNKRLRDFNRNRSHERWNLSTVHVSILTSIYQFILKNFQYKGISAFYITFFNYWIYIFTLHSLWWCNSIEMTFVYQINDLRF